MSEEEKLDSALAELPTFVKSFVYNLQVRDKTKLSYVYSVKYILDYLSMIVSKEIQSLSEIDIENCFVVNDYINYLELSGNKQVTNNNKLKVARMLCDYLYDKKMIHTHKDFPSIKKIRNTTIYSEAEYENYIGIADDISQNIWNIVASRSKVRDILLFEMVYSMGLKTSGCQKLNMCDIFLDEGYIRLNRKNKTLLYLNRTCKMLVKQYQQLRLLKGTKPSDPFLVNYKNERLSSRSIEKIIAGIVCAYDESLNPAFLRLICGAKLYKKTGDLSYVAEYMGIDYNTAEDHYFCIKNKSKQTRTIVVEMV